MTEALPESQSIQRRPVYARMMTRRERGRDIHPPSEREMQDAIRILEDESMQRYEPDLYAEAERILDDGTFAWPGTIGREPWSTS